MLRSGLLLSGLQAQPGPDRVIDIDPRVVTIDPRVVALDPRVEDLVVQTPQETTIQVSADILFGFDSAELSPAANDQLGGVTGAIRARLATSPNGVRVGVAGHTDSVGTDAYNLDLSQRRAAAVAAALGTALGGQPVTITARGFGETQPVADDKGGRDPEAALRNRRVTITITGA